MAATTTLEAVRTVPPTMLADPREPTIVHIEENQCSGIFKRCFNVVLCFNEKIPINYPAGARENPPSGPLVAAWIKESLAFALSEQPIFAGRLKRKDSGKFEIVQNDCGVRLVEMKIGMSLNEFLNLKTKKDLESLMVFWEDLDHEQNPLYSPLFYVQVTNFTCGGYSVGISCSTLLTDPFTLMSFLKKWTDIHAKIVTKTNSPNLPLFYRTNHKNNGINVNSPSLQSGTNVKMSNAGQSTIFTINGSDLGSQKFEKIATICIDEVGQKRDKKDMIFSSVLVRELVSTNKVKVQKISRKELSSFENQKDFSVNINEDGNWDDLGAKDLCFQEGNKPVHVSCWISSVLDEAFLMIVNQDSGIKAVITFPV